MLYARNTTTIHRILPSNSITFLFNYLHVHFIALKYSNIIILYCYTV
jgi:hypothetical protein